MSPVIYSCLACAPYVEYRSRRELRAGTVENRPTIKDQDKYPDIVSGYYQRTQLPSVRRQLRENSGLSMAKTRKVVSYNPCRSLRTSLKAEIDGEAWATLHSDTSRPFDKPRNGRIAVKVINHLGDEVMKVFRV